MSRNHQRLDRKRRLGQCSADPCNLGGDFLTANPAGPLFELVEISPVDIALQNVSYSLGENTEDDIHRHAADWIAANRDTVDAWLTAARRAG